MHRPLLTLLALIVLLMQPAALLHALSHGPAGVTGIGVGVTASTAGAEGDPDHVHSPAGLDCLQCLAFAAFGCAALPATLLLWRGPQPRQAPPIAAVVTLHGGTGAGYHARGPPRHA